MVEKDVEELRYKFDKYNEDFRNRLNDPSCTITECEKIRQEIRNENGFMGVVLELFEMGNDESDRVLTDKYVSLCEELATKLHLLGNNQAALNVIENEARPYVPDDNPDYAEIKSGLDQLEGRIRHVIDLKNRFIDEFIDEIKNSTTQLKDANCGLANCNDIRKRIQNAAVKLKGANGFSKELTDKYVSLCKELATKLHLLGNSQVALDVIESAIKCIGNTEDNSSILEELNRLKESFKKKSEPIPDETVVCPNCSKSNRKGAAFCTGCGNKLEPSPVPVPKPLPVKLILAIVAVLVIAAGGYFVKEGGIKDPKPPTPPTPPPVTISFDVPEGTKVVFDGKDVSGQKEIKVAAGSYAIQLDHQLFAFVYDKKLSVSKSGVIVPYKEIKLSPNIKNVAEKASLAVMNEILQQACSSNGVKLNPKIFAAEADANGKIAKAHRALRNYATKNSLNQLPVELVSVGNFDLISKDKTDFVKGTAEFSGAGANGKKINYSINTIFKLQGNNLLLNSLESISIKTQ